MDMDRRIIGLSLIIAMLLASTAAYAKMVSIEINANDKDVEGRIDTYSQINWAVLNLGGGVLYSEEGYTIGNVHFSLKDQVFIPALSLGLGFKGIGGRVETDERDMDTGAVGFMLLGDYDFRERYLNFPLVVYADFTWAPDPMSFADTERYTEFTTGLRFYIVKNAGLTTGYRHLYLRFDHDGRTDSASDSSVFVGLEINF